MSELEMQTAVQVLIESAETMDPDSSELEETAELLMGARIETFEDAGILTSNKGLVIRTPDGSEFQITIVRSR